MQRRPVIKSGVAIRAFGRWPDKVHRQMAMTHVVASASDAQGPEAPKARGPNTAATARRYVATVSASGLLLDAPIGAG